MPIAVRMAASVSMGEDLSKKPHAIWPQPPEPAIPAKLPPAIEKAYEQAERAFMVGGLDDAAAGMYGRALDLALQHIAPTARGTLAARIRSAVAANHIAPALADWADEVRLIRNNALHEADGTAHDDVQAVRAFCDLFLRSVYTLPGLIAERRAAAQPPA